MKMRTPVRKMVDEAREGNKNASQIVALHDFLEVWIPRGGFDFSDDKVKCPRPTIKILVALRTKPYAKRIVAFLNIEGMQISNLS